MVKLGEKNNIIRNITSLRWKGHVEKETEGSSTSEGSNVNWVLASSNGISVDIESSVLSKGVHSERTIPHMRVL